MFLGQFCTFLWECWEFYSLNSSKAAQNCMLTPQVLSACKILTLTMDCNQWFNLFWTETYQKQSAISSKIRLQNNSNYCPIQLLLLYRWDPLSQVPGHKVDLWRSSHGNSLCLLPVVTEDQPSGLCSPAVQDSAINLRSPLTAQD